MKIKKYIAVTLATMTVTSMVGCSNKDNGMTEWSYEDRKSSGVDYDKAIELSENKESNYVQSIGSKDELENEQYKVTLIDDERLTVYVTGKCNSILGSELWFEIENKKDYPIRLQCRDMSVNGYMANAIMSVDIMPGMKAKDRIIFRDINNVDDLNDIKGKLWLINNNSVSNSSTYEIEISY